MKTAIIFYSFSGNTKSAMEYLRQKLRLQEIASDTFSLKPQKETRSFLGQCFKALAGKKDEVYLLELDISIYDVIVFASPVWALSYAPALRGILDKLDLKDRKVGLVLTYGSGLGKEKAARKLEKDLLARGAKVLFSALLLGKNCHNRDYLDKALAALVEKIKNAPVAQLDRAQASGA